MYHKEFFKNKTTTLKKKVAGFALFGTTTLLAAIVGSCARVNGENFVLGNFESYMAPDLQKRLQTAYHNVKFESYPSNENAVGKFKSGSYSSAILSSYAIIELQKSGFLSKIDWSKFDLKNPDNPSEKITNAQEALSLFSIPIQQILTDKKTNQGIENLLEYSVPYFFQTVVFAYRGDVIAEFNDPQNPPSYGQILDLIGTKYKDRFDNGRLGTVEDEKTLFSIASLVYEEDTNQSRHVADSPFSKQNPSVDDYLKIFESLNHSTKDPDNANKQRIKGKGWRSNPSSIFLNSDSNTLVNRLAQPEGSQGALNGALFYNGDAIFSAVGGDNNKEADKAKINGKNFHIVTPKLPVYALDSMVINQRLPKSFHQAHQVIKNITLEGADDLSSEHVNNAFQSKISNIKLDKNGQASGTVAKDDDETAQFKYGTMLNFDFVYYTSPLRIFSHIPGTPTKLKSGTFEPDETSVKKSDDPNNPIDPSVVFPTANSVNNPFSKETSDDNKTTYTGGFFATAIASYDENKADNDAELAKQIQNAYNISIPKESEKNPALILEQPTNDVQKQVLVNAFRRFKNTL